MLTLRLFVYSSESLKFHFQEEERLLPSPYQTNCTDYEDLWKKNNKTGPRSQEMCKEWCLWNYYKSCGYCEKGLTMVEKPQKACINDDCHQDVKLRGVLDECRRNCMVNCKKLIYRYEIVDRFIYPYSDISREIESDEIKVFLIVKSPEVIVMSHKPLYTAMDAFSYIGGLMGCWLGMSVWACTGIAESAFLAVLRFLKPHMKKSHRLPPIRNPVLFKRNHQGTFVI
ncbi:uncharacterized protein NPIL_583871 [Nephila pilipes]|uniref:Uncharacterized protein n=1 Tax=Nephila pilipes TaxID=299642 RepID=A0A8X6TLU9_NEPPI|nr:uncharacterized protein NPIL_583871 [Nephila pilipes]